MKTIFDLMERVSVPRGVRVDRLPNGAIVLRRVKYLGARSANVNADGTHNAYTLEARRKSEHLYNGAKLYANHPERTNPGRERGLEEQLGRLRGPFEHKPDGSYADAYLNPKHPLAESIAWSAEFSPDDLGLSHNAQGRGRVQGQDCLIEEITHVRSVDFVTAAATTSGLMESRRAAPRFDVGSLLAILTDGALPAEQKVMQALAMLATNKTESVAPRARRAAAAPGLLESLWPRRRSPTAEAAMNDFLKRLK